MNKQFTLFLAAVLWFSSMGLSHAEQTTEGTLAAIETPKVHAHFIGYDGDDIVFHIINEGDVAITIRGLSFRRQILYRPIETGISVAPLSEDRPYREIVFRTTGDFVWSHHHMTKFQLAYYPGDSKEKRYAPIYPFSEKNTQ